MSGRKRNDATTEEITDGLPEGMRNLRACLVCSMVKTKEQFYADGCSNCGEKLAMANEMERVNDCTTGQFTGMIAVMKPQDSWVAKYQRVVNCQPGMYALTVTGQLPSEYVLELEEKNVKYHPRDGSLI